jgi:hypothetical protein
MGEGKLPEPEAVESPAWASSPSKDKLSARPSSAATKHSPNLDLSATDAPIAHADASASPSAVARRALPDRPCPRAPPRIFSFRGTSVNELGMSLRERPSIFRLASHAARRSGSSLATTAARMSGCLRACNTIRNRLVGLYKRNGLMANFLVLRMVGRCR